MSRFFKTALILASVTLPAWAQPVVSSVVNAASNRARALPFAGVARGALAVAYGSRMGPATLVQANAYPLRATLEGTSVTLVVAGSSVEGLMVYTSSSQIAFIVPSRVPAGNGEVRVTYNGQTSAPAPITVVETNLAIYTWTQNGNGQAVASHPSGRVVSVEESAKPDDVISIWSTGLGPVNEDDATPPTARDLGVTLEAIIGGRRAEILYRGRTSCCSALDQIVVRIPRDISAGCSTPIYFRGDGFVSNAVPLPTSVNGGPCADPLESPGLTLVGKERIRVASLLLDRVNDRSASGVQVLDFAHFGFVQFERAYYNNARGVPSPGACIVGHFDASSRFDPTHATLLNAGSTVTLTVQGNSFPLPRSEFGDYGQFFQGRNPNDVSGSGAVIAPGGADIAAFTLNHVLPAAPASQWREWATLSDVSTNQPLTLSWTDGPADGSVTIVGQTNGNLFAEFVCTASGADSQFVIPSDILRLVPQGPGSMAVVFSRSAPVTNRPISLDAFTFGRDVRYNRPVTFR